MEFFLNKIKPLNLGENVFKSFLTSKLHCGLESTKKKAKE